MMTMETETKIKNYISTENHTSVPLKEIPVISYDLFRSTVLVLLTDSSNHCVSYYAFSHQGGLKFICCIANDTNNTIKVLSHEAPVHAQLFSLTADHYAMHIYEREISENFGVEFLNHPWKKPVRYAFNRADRKQIINNYPFYKIESDELHEVGVGPIHAGVIEPGHFRFLCNGETVLHLEIQLGWQHRGIENLYLQKPSLLQRTILSESIAGDSAVSHALAFASLIESMGNVLVSPRLSIERAIAQELERIAMHIGDLSNMCIGLAYQLGASVFGALRTPVINYSQRWCGNRFGKGVIRAGGTHYPLNEELISELIKLLDNFEPRFMSMAIRLFNLPSALMRMERIGAVTGKQMNLIGAVGMTARMAGIDRDIRKSHPYGAYKDFSIDYARLKDGDVWARAMLRKLEITNSIKFIRTLVQELTKNNTQNEKPILEKDLTLAQSSLGISLVEGWRGEICHCAITDAAGKITHYKAKDPSFHNWMALALSLRDLEISDFPINNKSYNLSYCGHDL
jgi:Ni,Fe-hydrogenase III large subunit/Ni,Fe-hydrogenase III component G